MENFRESFRTCKTSYPTLVHNIIKGVILKVTKTHVLIHVGLKQEIFIPLKELKNSSVHAKRAQYVVGSSISLFLEDLETPMGDLVVNHHKSYQLLHYSRIWNELVNSTYVNGWVLNSVNGGYSVGVGGIVAFLPKNQVLPIRFPRFFIRSFKTYKVSVLKESPFQKNIVLSRKQAVLSWNYLQGMYGHKYKTELISFSDKL